MHVARKTTGSKLKASGAGTDTLDPKRLLSVLSDYQRGDFGVRMP